ncbi:hypothetical protein GDO86_006585, partial [Hymenochirus boettgeri]
ILLVAFLGIFVNSLRADEAYQYSETGCKGETIYHTVNIDEKIKVVVINVYSGKHLSHAVFDYSQNIIVYNMPYRGICVIAHMDIETFPALGIFERFIQSNRERRNELARLLRNYEVTNEQVSDLSQFGGAIEGLCTGIPTYWAREEPKPRRVFGVEGCAGIRFLFIHVGLCAGFHLF